MKKDNHCLKTHLLIRIIIKEKTEGLNLVPSLLILRHMVSIIQYPHVHSYSIRCVYIYISIVSNLQGQYSFKLSVHAP